MRPPDTRSASLRVWPAFAGYVVAFVALVAADAALIAIPAVLASLGGAPTLRRGADAFAFSETLEASVRVFTGSAFGVALISAMNASVLASLATLVQAVGTSGDLRRELRLGQARAGLGVLTIAVIGLWGLALACGAFADLVDIEKNGTLGFLDQAFRHASAPSLALAVVGVGLFPGIGEEAFFRGMMLKRLRARLPRWPAIVVTAIAFGVIHLDLVQGSFAVLLGLYLGWLVERTGSVRPAMAAHALNNAFFVFAAGFSDQEETRGLWPHAALIGGGLAACAGAVVLVRRKTSGADDSP
jgi:membrane protease YdiL (CAAX protease family)